jgi:hypothetical protein
MLEAVRGGFVKRLWDQSRDRFWGVVVGWQEAPHVDLLH